MGDSVQEEIGRSVQSADLAKLKTSVDTDTGEDSFADLVEDIIEGDADPDTVDDRIVSLLNELLDVPYIPDFLEEKIFGLAIDGVKVAIVQKQSGSSNQMRDVYTAPETRSLAVDFVSRWEGFRPTVYRDSVGVETIGYGFTPALPQWDAIMDRAPLKKQVARAILWRVLQGQVLPILAAIDQGGVLSAPHKVVAIASWAYNIGETAARTSTLAARLRNGNEEAVERELLRWVYAGGEVVEGLIHRRDAEKRLMERDERRLPDTPDTSASKIPHAEIAGVPAADLDAILDAHDPLDA